MREVFSISWSLIRIPRLFFSIFLLPIILSLFIVVIQLVVVSLVLQAMSPSINTPEAHLERTDKKEGVMRQLLLGQSEPYESLTICRWQTVRTANNQIVEVPPEGEGCKPDRLDVAVIVDDPINADVSEFVKHIKGNAERLHVCSTCSPDLVIRQDGKGASLHAHSFVSALLIPLIYNNDEIKKVILDVNTAFEDIATTFGSIYVHLPGFEAPISIDAARTHAGLIVNTITVLLIALWLTIKAHRNVLDYFARNGALMPMVASVGSKTFYRSIWFLTLFRVAIFLVAAIPMTVLFAYTESAADMDQGLFTASSIPDFAWMVTLTTGLGLAALISSIGELQHRHYLFSFLYRYASLVICIVGAILWLFTLLGGGDFVLFLRSALASLPVIGLTPVLLSPVFRPSLSVLALHTFLSLGLMWGILRYNQRWFAAHLEEL
ncbi:MAG: hypothetical protein KDD62_09365 [Bdellovibrionales bacterium]|nr:hypothetical protein [Bdellovibrionales bacterium]